MLDWQQSFGGSDDETTTSISRLNDGSLAVLGDAYSNNNGDVQNSGYHWGTETVHPPNSPAFTVNTGDFWVIRINSPLNNPSGVNGENPGFTFHLSPNPASGSFTIEADDIREIQISDLSGQLVYHSRVDENNAGKSSINIDWKPGLYMITVLTGKGITSRKLVVTGQ